MKWILWSLAGLMALGIALNLAGWEHVSQSRLPAKQAEHTPQPKPPEPKPAPEPVAPPLELLEFEGYIEDFGGRVEGKIRNNTEKAYRYAQVTFNLYNSDDEQVGTAMANINGLEPGGTWKFKAVAFTQGWEKLKLDKITGF